MRDCEELKIGETIDLDLYFYNGDRHVRGKATVISIEGKISINVDGVSIEGTSSILDITFEINGKKLRGICCRNTGNLVFLDTYVEDLLKSRNI